MRVLVTGATGFIGMPLCQVLVNRGHTVMGVSRKPPTDCDQLKGVAYVAYQLGDPLPESVVNFTPEVIVHLAWNGIPDFSADTCLANVFAQIKFLDELEKFPYLGKILVSGTCNEYGTQSGVCHETERSPPNSYFSWAKQTLCDYFNIFCKKNSIPLLWFRIFYVYGPRQRSAALIPTLLRAFRMGQDPEIKNPYAANDFIFVDDVVDAFLKGVEDKDAAGILNLGSGRLTKVSDVAKIAERISGQHKMSRENLMVGHPSPDAQLAMMADISNAKLTLAWAPKVDLAQGIAHTLETMP